jgi:hypothetical protein
MTEIAFMVMPFGRKKPTILGPGVPAEVDFDALWHEVHRPVLEELGYVAVRADEDVGAIIVLEMIARLAAADLVVADVSLANSNVYYEIGLRHAAIKDHAVLVAADWGEPVFDLAQIRQARYPLPDGAMKDPAAVAAAKAVLVEAIPPLAEGKSPFHQAVPNPPARKTAAFSEYVAQLNEFGTSVRTIRLTVEKDRRAELTRELVATQGGRRAVQESVVLELVRLVRDNLPWAELLEYIDGLPDPQRRHPSVVEQRAIALSGLGHLSEATGVLEQLIEEFGPTSDRLGILGGRYKRLYRAATTDAARRIYLEKAINAYERGMLTDLNDYYPASNLPRLYRRRNDDGDDRRAREAAAVTLVACQASADRADDDHWAAQVMLGAAFDTGDPAAARDVLRGMLRQQIPGWKIASTAQDLEESLDLLPANAAREELEAILADVKALA